MRRRMMMRQEEDEMKEWQLLDTVDFAIDASKEYDLNGITEIFVYGNLLKCASDAISGMQATVNGTGIGLLLDTAKSSASGTYQYGHAKYNGLFWETMASAGAISKTNFSLNASNAKHPYNVRLDVGAANKLNIGASSPAYPIASGTLEIYVR